MVITDNQNSQKVYKIEKISREKVIDERDNKSQISEIYDSTSTNSWNEPCYWYEPWIKIGLDSNVSYVGHLGEEKRKNFIYCADSFPYSSWQKDDYVLIDNELTQNYHLDHVFDKDDEHIDDIIKLVSSDLSKFIAQREKFLENRHRVLEAFRLLEERRKAEEIKTNLTEQIINLRTSKKALIDEQSKNIKESEKVKKTKFELEKNSKNQAEISKKRGDNELAKQEREIIGLKSDLTKANNEIKKISQQLLELDILKEKEIQLDIWSDIFPKQTPVEVKKKLNELSENFENNSQEKKDKDSIIRELESQIKILQNQADKNEGPVWKGIVTEVKPKKEKGKQKEFLSNREATEEKKVKKNISNRRNIENKKRKSDKKHNSEEKKISDSLKIKKEELKGLIERTRRLNQEEKEILKNLISRGKLSKKQRNFDTFQTLLKKLAIGNQRKVVKFLLKEERKDSRNYKKLLSELQAVEVRKIRKQQELQARIEVQNRCVIL